MRDDGIPVFSFEGVSFGGKTGEILVENWIPGDETVRSQDVDAPGYPSIMVGDDIPHPPSWTFELSTNVFSVDEAIAVVAEMRRLWRSPTWRQPGVVGELRYRVGSEERVVVGRPRRFTPPNGDVLAQIGVARFMCDFQLTDPRTFSGSIESITLSLVPESTGGIIFPLKFPMTTTVTGGVRAGFVENVGSAPAPLVVEFKGPVKNPRIYTDEWEIGIQGNLAYDEAVTVDTLAMTVVDQDGDFVGGRLTRATRLRKAAVLPGQTEVKFTGGDSTGTARVNVSWRDANYGI